MRDGKHAKVKERRREDILRFRADARKLILVAIGTPLDHFSLLFLFLFFFHFFIYVSAAYILQFSDSNSIHFWVLKSIVSFAFLWHLGIVFKQKINIRLYLTNSGCITIPID